MTDLIKPGAGILFMKIGTHAQESLDSIIARKAKEIDDTGYAMWGYGGNTCHPRTMVQPFAEEFAAAGSPIVLCMHEMDSRHMAEQLRADEFSIDGFEWKKIPSTINVMGSRYALVIKNLRQETHKLPLNQTRVAVGRSLGKLGTRYIVGQVDKACLEVTDAPEISNTEEDTKLMQIDLVADLESPYAVFLR
ncbi:MAG: hypothetical protein BroJett013_22840 [Alphaproteobacteria bacterium]|nr:MAG: hypothetical protein BroJett013_22840 [Alphaproteobacteria bacterium]